MKSERPWQEPYLKAVLETDDTRLLGRIRTAKEVLETRLYELSSQDGHASEERQEVSSALAALNRLLAERIGNPNSICRICLEPVSLEACKTDENGKIVHERCYVRELLANAADDSDGQR